MSTIAFDVTTTPRPQLRLTRRGRVVVGSLLAAPVAVALALSAFSGAPAQAGPAAPVGSEVDAAQFEYITVASGESLWDLAAWVAPEADPREVIADIVALNRISETSIQPGQRLAIPTRYAD